MVICKNCGSDAVVSDSHFSQVSVKFQGNVNGGTPVIIYGECRSKIMNEMRASVFHRKRAFICSLNVNLRNKEHCREL